MLIPAVLEILFFISALSYLLYLLSFTKTLSTKESSHSLNSIPVSILICAKNEAQNLKKNLPSILNQNYSDFEIIVVNDQSTDHTLQILKNFQKEFSNLKVFSTSGKSNKKKALRLAKQKASYSIFLQTDADCKVNSRNWISLMTQGLDEHHEVVLGYGPNYQKASFLNWLQNYETLTTALQYFTAALGDSPYMGVGRNMAYTKKLNDSIILTQKEKDLLSGDDDLFIQHAKKLTKFKVQTHPDSFAYSKSEDTLTNWWNQKRRHITTSNFYSLKDQIILSGIFLMKLYFWFYSIWLLFQLTNPYHLGLFIFITVMLVSVYAKAALQFRTGKIWILSPILDFCLICFQFSLYISNLVAPYKKWK
jgi:cellulose synthase/poly-beta-1,6-N-acetylglucosamine synthase-like glycosyltransferase